MTNIGWYAIKLKQPTTNPSKLTFNGAEEVRPKKRNSLDRSNVTVSKKNKKSDWKSIRA